MQAEDSAVPSVLSALLGAAACLRSTGGTKMVLLAKVPSLACPLHLRAGQGQLKTSGASTMQPQSSLLQLHCTARPSGAMGASQQSSTQM